MFTGILIAAVIGLAAALAYFINDRNTQREIARGLYRTVSLPKAAQAVSLVPRTESLEYKLEQALRRGERLEQTSDRLEAENRRLKADHLDLDAAHRRLQRDYLSQFSQGCQFVNETVVVFAENERLRALLTEERHAKELAQLQLQRYKRRNDPCHGEN